MYSDTQIFKVNGDKKDNLKATLELVDKLCGSTVKSYKFDSNHFELFWYYDSSKGAYPTPDKLKVVDMMPFIEKFLEEADYTNCGYYDGDGSCNKGWCVEYNKSDFYSIIVIKPFWTYYSK